MPRQFGLPDPSTLARYQIWDCYFTPAHSHPGKDGTRRLLQDIERSQPAIQAAQIQRLCYFPHVGIGTTGDRELEARLRADPGIVLKPLQRWPRLLLAMLQLNPHQVAASMDALNQWLRDGPLVGVYLPGGGPAAMTCTERNVERLVERVVQLRGVIMQHTWFKTGGKQGPGESTPTELTELARRFPDHKFICAHAGGEWEQGIRAVQDQPNILIETSGFDATAGFLEMGIRELGAERILFGSHLPSRSLGTELGKVVGAQMTEDQRVRILGGNFRSLLQESRRID